MNEYIKKDYEYQRLIPFIYGRVGKTRFMVGERSKGLKSHCLVINKNWIDSIVYFQAGFEGFQFYKKWDDRNSV